MKYEDFKKVQQGQTISGGFAVSDDNVKFCVYVTEDYNIFPVTHWAVKNGLDWQKMTEEEFNIMKFEVILNVDI